MGYWEEVMRSSRDAVVLSYSFYTSYFVWIRAAWISQVLSHYSSMFDTMLKLSTSWNQWSSVFWLLNFIFMCMIICLQVCICTPGACEGQKRLWDVPGAMDTCEILCAAEIRTWVLCKCSKCSSQLSHLSSQVFCHYMVRLFCTSAIA